MFLIPLTQPESVALVIHALRVAGGEADCSSCPARKVCMKQCLAIAASIDNMLQSGMLPSVEDSAPEPPPEPKAPAPGPGHLKIIK